MRRPSGPKGLLIFDLDGTLFSGVNATVGAVNEAFRRRGVEPPPPATICTWYGKPTADFGVWLESLSPDGALGGVAGEVLRREVELVSERGESLPGAVEAVGVLAAAGHTMAICSNGGHDYVHRALEKCGIRRHFMMIRHRKFDHDRKPAMARELLDAIPARPAAVIGDRHDDIAAAIENGVFAVGAAYGFGGAGELKGAHAVIKSAAELPGVIGRLFAEGSCGDAP